MSLEDSGRGFKFLQGKILQAALHKDELTDGCTASHRIKQALQSSAHATHRTFLNA